MVNKTKITKKKSCCGNKSNCERQDSGRRKGFGHGTSTFTAKLPQNN